MWDYGKGRPDYEQAVHYIRYTFDVFETQKVVKLAFPTQV